MQKSIFALLHDIFLDFLIVYILDSVMVDFGALSDDTCGGTFIKSTDLAAAPAKKVEPWKIEKLEGVREFTARIGPTGGEKGYEAITGKSELRIS